MPFKPGQSGNPNGRPLKNRALTEILTTAGNHTMPSGAGRAARKRVLAALVWQAATTGRVEFEPGRVVELQPSEWAGVVRWLYSHIDGAARAEFDVSIDSPVKGYFTFSPDDWDSLQEGENQ